MSNLLDFWDALRFHFVFVLIPAGVLGVLVVHFTVLFVVRKAQTMRALPYTRDMLALKLVLSVTYFIFFNDRSIFSSAGKSQAIIVLLLIHAVVRGLYAGLRTRKMSIVPIELVMIAMESVVVSLFEYLGLFLL